MPKWGLTKEQREARPWGIPSDLLKPYKTITDPVHGDIHVTLLEGRFLDSAPMQRLRRIRQLGTTHLVYPGATHNRFAHALGTLRAAQDLLDAVIDNRNGPHPHVSWLDEWDPTREKSGISEYEFKLAEVTVIARLGALLHDLGHVPFGHSIEDDLEILDPHDVNEARFQTLWAQMPPPLMRDLQPAEPAFLVEVHNLIVSKVRDQNDEIVARDVSDLRYPFVADVVGNTICADLVDYLRRDHMFTGLPFGIGYRFASEFYVSPSKLVRFKKRMVIGLTRDGLERHDVVTEVLKYLRYRYELSERALTQHAKLAADAMVGKLLELWRDALWTAAASEKYQKLVDSYGKDIETLRLRVERQASAPTPNEIDAAVTEHLEARLLRSGDDGVLEYLAEWGADAGTDTRRSAVGKLARDLLDRRLYKQIGTAHDAETRALAADLHRDFGTRGRRRELEEGAARCAGIKEKWQVVLWLPAPKMRLKVAEVLVERDGVTNHLDAVNQPRAKDIYDAHQQLWAVSVFAHSDVTAKQAEVVRAYLGERLEIKVLSRDGSNPGTLVDVAVRRVVAARELTFNQHDRLVELVANSDIAAHRGETPTFEDLYDRVEQLAQAEGLFDGLADDAVG